MLLASSFLFKPAYAADNSGQTLCRASEAVIFSCQLEIKTVSICGQVKQNRAVYRYGRPGRIELELTDLHRALNGIARGGEEEIITTFLGFSYVIYAINYRSLNPNFDYDRAESEENDFYGVYVEDYGLLVKKSGHVISRQACRVSSDIDNATRGIIPKVNL